MFLNLRFKQVWSCC